MELKGRVNKKHLAATLLIGITLIAVATAQIGTLEENGGEYDLDVEMTPPEAGDTNVNFTATLETLDSDADAALIYWNYTEGEDVEPEDINQKGPANIATTDEGEESQVKSVYTGLQLETDYEAQAHAEPIVWDDETLMKNFIDKDGERGGGAMREVSESETAMEEVSQSEEAMEEVGDSPVGLAEFLGSPYVEDTVWSSETGSEIFWQEAGEVNIDFYYGYWESTLDLSEVDKIIFKVWYDGNQEFNFYIGGDLIESFEPSSDTWVEKEFSDASGYDGEQNVKLEYGEFEVNSQQLVDGPSGGKAIMFDREGSSNEGRFADLKFE